jgi:RNA polymerase-binding transcription factor DksA
MTKSVARYSDEDLMEFKALIDKKMERAKEQLESLQEQILEITENTSDEHGGDWVDDSSTSSDIEMLNRMAIRQRQYVRDLENALLRIRNKTYGICSVTGELIDKRRLMAVPTTTKRLEVKLGQIKPEPTPPEEDDDDEENTPNAKKEKKKKPAEKKIITRVIKKSSSTPPKAVPIDDDDDDDDLYDEDVSFLDDDDEEILKNSIEDFEELPDDDELPDNEEEEEDY